MPTSHADVEQFQRDFSNALFVGMANGGASIGDPCESLEARSCPVTLTYIAGSKVVLFVMTVPTTSTFTTDLSTATPAFENLRTNFELAGDWGKSPYSVEVGPATISEVSGGVGAYTEAHLDEHHLFFIGMAGSIIGTLCGYGHWRLVGRSIDQYVGVTGMVSSARTFFTPGMNLDIREPQRRIKKVYYTHETSTLIDTVSTRHTVCLHLHT